MLAEAVLLDLVHGCASCAGSSISLKESSSDAHVFLLCGRRLQDPETKTLLDRFARSCRSAQVVTGVSTAECLYRFKQTLDQLDLSSVTVLTTSRGRDVLLRYQEQLFTEMYSLHYTVPVDDVTCPTCASHAHTDSPAGKMTEEQEVSRFLQQLPALGGKITVLRSTLIPDCFGHGFSSRPGGVSCIPTLSSLNLFSSSRRRDPIAVVTENRRRLGLHAGFDHKLMRMVKVNHANDVWVMGRSEPESYDGIVTNQTGVVLVAPGADCMPLLFADPVSKVIGAAHAGWRGTLMGVAMATVKAMVTEFGCRESDIVVAVGPSVGACCFTLDRQQALNFASIHPDCVTDLESARPHVSIRQANRILLQRGGILPEHIHDDVVTERPCVTPCTSCQPKLYFSHVRDGLNFGTQVGFLWIRDTAGQSPPAAADMSL